MARLPTRRRGGRNNHGLHDLFRSQRQGWLRQLDVTFPTPGRNEGAVRAANALEAGKPGNIRAQVDLSGTIGSEPVRGLMRATHRWNHREIETHQRRAHQIHGYGIESGHNEPGSLWRGMQRTFPLAADNPVDD